MGRGKKERVGVDPDEFDAGKTVAGPFLGDIVVLEEIVAKVDGVEFANLFDAKVNKDSADEDGAPLVAP